ncbi:unnamed protein product, partial [marine sediment metagenome]
GVEAASACVGRVSPQQNPGWVKRALVDAGKHVQGVARKEIRSGAGPPRHGTLTTRSGGLRRSIQLDRGPLPNAIDVRSDKFWALFHEEGLGRYPKRPFMAPALGKSEKEVGRIFEAELAKELRK